MAGAVNNGNSRNAGGSNGGPYYPRVNRDMIVIEETDEKYIYDIKFYNGISTETINTTVGRTTSAVDEWVEEVEQKFARQLEDENLIVGLDIEWVRLSETDKRNKVAVLQLCVARQCLIFPFFGMVSKNKNNKKNKKGDKDQKIFGKVDIPESLINFLNDQRITFVGCGIDQDARMLRVDHELTVAKSEELGGLADYKLGREDLYKSGLKDLMWIVLGQTLPKNSEITLSKWDIGHQNHVGILRYDQIRHACLDAYASYKLGMELMRRRPPTVNNGYPQKDFNKAPQSQGPKTANQGDWRSYKESHRSKPTLIDYLK